MFLTLHELTIVGSFIGAQNAFAFKKIIDKVTIVAAALPFQLSEVSLALLEVALELVLFGGFLAPTISLVIFIISYEFGTLTDICSFSMC